jgi:KDO2-lipid IV(A) lauroyltransferase
MAKSFLKRRRNDLIYIVIRVLLYSVKILPRRLGLLVFGFVGRLFFLFPTVEKERTYENLKRIFSDKWSEKRIKRTAGNIYYQLGKNLYDSIYLTICSDKQFFNVVKHNDLSRLKEIYNKGNGIIGVAGHIGCFEMTIHVIARSGLNCVTIGQHLYDKRMEDLIVSFRKRNNIIYLHRDGSGREILKLLKKGHFFGVLIDQDTKIDGVFANFLGIPAFTPSAPVRMAMKYNLPLFVAVTARQKDNTHRFELRGPYELENSDDPNRDLVMNVQKVNDVLSEWIMENPDQWVWMHRRWKTRPDDEGFEDVPNIENY